MQDDCDDLIEAASRPLDIERGPGRRALVRGVDGKTMRSVDLQDRACHAAGVFAAGVALLGSANRGCTDA